MSAPAIKTYYHLVKPGIVRGNALAALAGFCFAVGYYHSFSFASFAGMLLGIVLVVASGCVFNNYLDRNIDRKMERTKKRALVTGEVSPSAAIIYGALLLIIGITSLLLFTNYITSLVALFGFFAYVILYGVGKRTTIHGTLVGAISGAIPPVVGYTAVSHKLDAAALILFVTMFVWQLPHFYAIAMFRLKDYTSAHIPVLPVKKGMQATRSAILLSIFVFTITSSLLSLFGYTGYIYLFSIVSLGLYWLISAWRTRSRDDISWARYVFGRSLIVLLAWNLLLCVGALLP